jgi:TonB family protein
MLSTGVAFAGEEDRPVSCADSSSSDLQILNGAKSPELKPYVQKAVKKIRDHWFSLVPPSALEPERKYGCTVIQFTVEAEGKVKDMKLSEPSGDVGMDRAAWGGITASNPFDSFPKAVKEKEITLRIRFLYNPANRPKEDRKDSPPPGARSSQLAYSQLL